MSKRILVVDDDAQMVQSLKDVLQIKGWRVHGVLSGQDAIDVVEVEGFDAVLMDVRMPGIDGIEAYRRIRELRPNLPVFLMTAHAFTHEVAQAARQGVRRVFSKPLDLDTLFTTLNAATDS